MKGSLSDVIKQNVNYYNEIANNYDQFLKNEPENETVRQEIAKIFQKWVPNGCILDFGGGTGQDLSWMIQRDYTIYFCEPSIKMREIAMANFYFHSPEKVIFLEEPQTNFTQWPNQLPFPEKADGVLSNFAVLNCIPDPSIALKSLSLILKPGGHLFLLVLDSRKKILFNKYLFPSLKKFVFSNPTIQKIYYNNFYHIVYLHSYQQLKKSASPYFTFYKKDEFFEFGFMLLHLIKK